MTHNCLVGKYTCTYYVSLIPCVGSLVLLTLLLGTGAILMSTGQVLGLGSSGSITATAGSGDASVSKHSIILEAGSSGTSATGGMISTALTVMF